MLFTWDINLPASTAESAPVTQTLKVAHGIITWVSVLFPPGCQRLAHCVIHHYSKQIFPSVEDMDLCGDTFPIEWNEYYEMYAEPYILRFTGWNDDECYAHKLTIKIAVLPRRAIIALAVVDAIKGILSMLSPKRLFTARE